jgi:hypothetical protein
VTKPADRSDAERDPELILQITPEPTDVERGALLAALAIMLTEPVAAIADGQDQVSPSRWARAGRAAALKTRQFQRGWGRS